MEVGTRQGAVDEAATAVAVIRVDDLAVESASAAFRALLGGRELATLGLREVVRAAVATGEVVRHPPGPWGAVDEPRWLLAPLAGSPGRVLAVVAPVARPGREEEFAEPEAPILADRAVAFPTGGVPGRRYDGSSAERLRLAMEALGAGVWELDLRAGTVEVDEAGRRLLDLPARGPLTWETLVGRVHPDDRRALLAAVERAAGTERWSLEIRVIGLVEGEIRWIETCGRVHPAPDGVPRRVVGTFRDVTAERAARESELRYQRFRDVLVGVVGHDLRGPLAAIRMTAELLMRGGALGPRESQMVQRIVSSSARMGLMLRQLVELTRLRLASPVVPLEPRSVELVALFDEVVAEVRAARPEVRVAVRSAGPVAGCWDPDRLAQVLTNLVTNAAGPFEAEVEVRLGVFEHEVRVEVHNGRLELPRSALDALFDPFSGGTKPVGDTGLGLGVWIARQFARAHGGDVRARSAPGRGLTFELVLPRVVPPAR